MFRMRGVINYFQTLSLLLLVFKTLMVGWYARKSTVTRMTERKVKNRTGIFHGKNPLAIVVMWRGKEICRYGSLEEFVDSHLELVEALEKKQEDLLTDEYRDNT